MSSVGSSPRVWGIRRPSPITPPPPWFIPTRVGNTQIPLSPFWAQTVHPHACGEYQWGRLRESRWLGSSPRVWGIRSPRRGYGLHRRFIPTRVGNTPISRHSMATTAVHPHACGEYECCCKWCCLQRGSSPRVWGIPVRSRSGHVAGRFIPTRVGNTLHRLRRPRSGPVHPHACGEYSSGRCKK